MAWLSNNCVTIISFIISVASVCYARKANDKSDEANQLSSKSIAIDYDATFNDFNIQLRKNMSEIMKLRKDFITMKSQNKEYMSQTTKWIIYTIASLRTQKQFMRPSEYYYHYEELENLGEDIRSQCETLIKIAESSEKENLFNDEIFVENYNETIRYFDLIIKKLEMKIDNNF